jgi:long-subunit fatty acid transport protein
VDDGFATDIQTDVKSNYESPLSIGVGAAWHLENSKFHVAAEWFDGVNDYPVLELTPFTSQTTGTKMLRSLRHKLDSVINFGVGFEHEFGPTYSGYLGFNTDRSAYNPESDVATTAYDIWHLSAGGKWSLKKLDLRFGGRYAWGVQNVQQAIELNPASEGEVLGSEADVGLKFSQLTFLLGFNLDI